MKNGFKHIFINIDAMLTLRREGLALCIVLALLSCKSTEVNESGNVAQSEIHQALYATYDEQTNTTTAEAVFRFGGQGGTTLHLTPPSVITVNDSTLEGRDEFLQGYIYRTKKKGFLSKWVFNWTDTEGEKYQNTLRIETATLDSLPTEWEMNHDYSIRWKGPLPRGDESLQLYIHPDSGRTITLTPEVEDPHRFLVSAQTWAELKPGKVLVYIKRTTATRLAESTHIGGSATIEFEGEKHSVFIK